MEVREFLSKLDDIPYAIRFLSRRQAEGSRAQFAAAACRKPPAANVSLTSLPRKSSDCCVSSVGSRDLAVDDRTTGIGIPLGFNDKKVPRPIAYSSSPCRSFSILLLSLKYYVGRKCTS